MFPERCAARMVASVGRCGDAACRRSTLLRRAASRCSVSRSRFDESARCVASAPRHIGQRCGSRFRSEPARLPSRRGRAGRRPGDGHTSCRLRAVGTGQTVRRRACRRTWSLTSSAVAWCACGCSRASLPDSALVSSPAARLRLPHAAYRVARGCRRAPNPRVESGQHPADFLGCVVSRRHDARALHLLVQVAFCRGGVLRRPPVDFGANGASRGIASAIVADDSRVRRACGGDVTQRRGVVTVPMMNNSPGRPAAAVWCIRRLLGRLAIGCRRLAI